MNSVLLLFYFVIFAIMTTIEEEIDNLKKFLGELPTIQLIEHLGESDQ